MLIFLSHGNITQVLHCVGILTLEQHGCELRGSTYTGIFFNSKYYSATLLAVVESADTKEPRIRRADYKLYGIFDCREDWCP